MHMYTYIYVYMHTQMCVHTRGHTITCTCRDVPKAAPPAKAPTPLRPSSGPRRCSGRGGQSPAAVDKAARHASQGPLRSPKDHISWSLPNQQYTTYPPPGKDQMRLNEGLSRAYLVLVLSGGCMCGGYS